MIYLSHKARRQTHKNQTNKKKNPTITEGKKEKKQPIKFASSIHNILQTVSGEVKKVSWVSESSPPYKVYLV